MKTEHQTCQPGELLVGADWAIAHGDADGLAHCAAQLLPAVDRQLAHELEEWTHLCERNFDIAAERWPSLRKRIAARLVH